MDKTGEYSNRLHFGKFEKRRPTFTFLQFISDYSKMSFTQLGNHSQLYLAMILQMKNSCFANLTFRTHN